MNHALKAVSSVCIFGRNREYVFNAAQRSVSTHDKKAFLTGRQMEMMHLLVEKRGELLVCPEVEKRLGINAVNQHVVVCKLRKKIKSLSGEADCPLVNLSGGYFLALPDKEYKERFTFGRFTYYPAIRRLVSGKEERYLTVLQDRLFQPLLRSKNRMVPKEVLYGKCLRAGRKPEAKLVDVVFCHIRDTLDGMRLGENGGDHIVTTWGVGCTLSDKKVSRLELPGKKRGERTHLLKRLSALRRSKRAPKTPVPAGVPAHL